MSDPLGVGLVGCGMIGQIHADGVAKMAADGEVAAVACADPDPAARAAVLRNCAFAEAVADPAEVIGHPEVHAVLVAAPTAAHPALVEAVAAAGKALLCEKPLATDLAAVEAMARHVADAGITAQVGFHARFHPLMRRLHQLATGGELGRPMAYSVRDDQYWPTGQVVPGHSSWRSERTQSGGGALLEHSIHAVDLLCWCFGPVARVQAATRSTFGFEVEDVAALTLEHHSGVTGTLLSVFNGVRGREERRIEAFFEHGAVEVTTDFIVGAPEDSLLVQRPDTPAERPDLPALREEHFAGMGLARRDFLFYTYPADRSWVAAAGSGRPGDPTFADALAAHRVVDAAYRSAALGQAVEVAR